MIRLRNTAQIDSSTVQDYTTEPMELNSKLLNMIIKINQMNVLTIDPRHQLAKQQLTKHPTQTCQNKYPKIQIGQ